MPSFLQPKLQKGKNTGLTGTWGGSVLNPLMEAPGRAELVTPGIRVLPLLKALS